MAEVLVEFTDPVRGTDGNLYVARACGAEAETGLWQGWLEFVNPATQEAFRSGRETTQPNRTDTVYWATGLTAVYLEGALERALHPLVRPTAKIPAPPHFDGPAPDVADDPPPTESILNPFSVYRKGEALLRRQLAAMSVWHLVNIVRAHELSDLSSPSLNALSAGQLIDLIVREVRARMDQPLAR